MSKRKDIKSKDLSISFKHTLEQYNKKYRNHPEKLVKITKKQAEEFDKKYGYYKINNKTFSLEFDNYLLKNRKWALINDTYYEIPKAPKFLWFRNLKASTQIIIGLLTLTVVAGAIVGPYYINYFSRIVCRTAEDLVTKDDQKHRAEILSTADISNTTVILGEEFNTVVSIKQDKKEDYNIKDIELYVYKKNESGETVKTKLVKDVDYTVNNEGEKATIKVKAEAVKGKLELDVIFKDISFNNIVKFEDKTVGYNEAGYDFAYELKSSEKPLPEGSTVTYTYNSQSQNTPFHFSNFGSYTVSLKIERAEYHTFTKTATLKIEKKDFPYADKISLKDLSCSENNAQPATLDNTSGVTPTSTTIKYFVDNNWVTFDEWGQSLPTGGTRNPGTYKVHAKLEFQNYNEFNTKDYDYKINEYGKIQIGFNVKENGGKWKEGGDDIKYSDSIKNWPTHKTFNDFENTVSPPITGDNVPTKEGYKFKGWYTAKTGGTKYENTTVITEEENTVTAYAQFDPIGYNATFNNNGGVINKGGAIQTSLEIKTDEKIFEKLNNIYIPSHTYAEFDHWEMSKQSKPSESITIDANTLMPPEPITIKPVWKTYDVHIMLNGVEQTSQKLSNVLQVFSDDFHVVIPSGQVIDKYQYNFDGSATYTDYTNGMPFKPKLVQTSYNKNVYFNVVTKAAPAIIEVFLDAGEGKFIDGDTDNKTLDIEKGKTLSDVLAITGTPQKNGQTATKWVDDSGNTVSLDTQLTDDRVIVHAQYGGSY